MSQRTRIHRSLVEKEKQTWRLQNEENQNEDRLRMSELKVEAVYIDIATKRLGERDRLNGS